MCKRVIVFPMFCVGRGSTVNSEVLAAKGKHEKTLCVNKIQALFCQNVSVLCDVSCMVQNHRKYRQVISAEKTRWNNILLFRCSVVLFIFHAFYKVWRRAREHRKLRHFSTAKKTRENTMILFRFSIILYLRRVFNMFLCILFNSKTCEFRPHEQARK